MKLPRISCLVFVLFIFGCSGGSTGTNSTSTLIQNSSTGSDTATSSFTSIAGLWDASGISDGVRIVSFIEILPSGWLTFYNYNALDSCYTGSSTLLRSVGNNQYQVSLDSGSPNATFTANVINNQISIVSADGSAVAQRVNTLNPTFLACQGNELVNTTVFNDDGTVWVLPLPMPLVPVKPPGIDPTPTSSENWSTDTRGIAGSWNSSGRIDGLFDESYLVITGNGSFIVADYMGDEFALGEFGIAENCYVVDTTPIEYGGNNLYRNFADNEYFVFEATVTNDTLQITAADTGATVSYPRAVGLDGQFNQCR